MGLNLFCIGNTISLITQFFRQVIYTKCKDVLLVTTRFSGQKINTMNKGTVKFFNEVKGFGFIKGDDGQEIFVHVTGLNENINENDQVLYDTEVGRRGMNAINVRLA